MAVILLYFAEFGSFAGNYLKVVKIDPYCLGQNVAQRI